MKTRFTEIANRITGFSTPVFGVSWNPPSLEAETARALIAYLEDRRVLYIDYEDEQIKYSVESVLKIREKLTSVLERHDRSSPLALSIANMRAACREFLDKTEKINVGKLVVDIYHQRRNPHAKDFFKALEELRATCGYHVAQIAVRYGINVEQQLAAILPAPFDNEKDKQNGRA